MPCPSAAGYAFPGEAYALPSSATWAAPAANFAELPAISIVNRNTRQVVAARLYTAQGVVDGSVVDQLSILLADTRQPKKPKIGTIDTRLVQLLYRTAYHFGAAAVEVTSAYRKPERRREGLHGLGRAIDFALPGVKPEAVAQYLRRLPCVGVGIYMHPRTRFVHLDVRPHSFHWLDASPPGRTYRGMPLGDPGINKRDAAYSQTDDLPEEMVPHSVLRHGPAQAD